MYQEQYQILRRMMRSYKAPSLVSIRATVYILFGFFVLGLLFFHVPHASAQTAFEQFGQATRLSDTSPIIIIARLIRVFLGFTGIILTILVIYAGWLYMSSLGQAAKIDKAKKLLKQAIVGMLIIWFSFSISWWILNQLLEASQPQATVVTAKRYAEPLKGALGAGIINSHYPPIGAIDIPRNTKIFVEFKEPINPASMINNFEEGQESGELNFENIKITGIAAAQDDGDIVLTSDQVQVYFDQTKKFFVFRPVNYLGNSQKNTNYSVQLLPGIEKLDGTAAFSGVHNRGYGWSFQVGTEVDITPPRIVSVIPRNDAIEPRNISVEVTFNEAMDPVVSQGSYIDEQEPLFTNIKVTFDRDANGGLIEPLHVNGAFEMSNAYRTVSFTTTDACAQDPCGDTIYCLPGDKDLTANIKAGDVDIQNMPQALLFDALPNGLVDASGNSLDGDGDGKACQGIRNLDRCPNGNEDGYNWEFHTTAEINSTVPHVVSLNPNREQGEISLTDPITATFNTFLKGSTINSNTVSLWPQNYVGAVVDSWWFYSTKEDFLEPNRSIVSINHPTLVAPEQGAENYYPVFNQGLKSAYQICMFPASLERTACAGGVSEENPYCCNGQPSDKACRTLQRDADDEAGNQELPLN